MQQHMIPQDVTGYKFNLFGILNVSQFLQLLIPCVITFLLWQLKVPLYIFIPLGILLVGYGVIAAFVPINDRPLSHWVITFLKLLYSPTRFYWRRAAFIPEIFNYEGKNERESTTEVENTNATQPVNKRGAAQDFFYTLDNNESYDPLEAEQALRINNVLSDFDLVQVEQVAPVSSGPQRPNVSENQALRQRQIQAPEELFSSST